jgi:predicted PurR-regulated permease PerM
MEQTPDTTTYTSPPVQPGRDLRQERFESAQRAWKLLGMSLFSVTPKGLARGILMLGALAVLVWLSIASWPALLPFIVGGVLAYIVFPLVNFFDRLMPRYLAALLGILLVLGGFVALLWVIIPPLVSQTVALVQQIPPDLTLKDISNMLIVQLQFLPPNLKALVIEAINKTSAHMQENIHAFFPALFSTNSILQLMNAIGFILGLVVLPTWLLTVLKDQPRAQRTLLNILPTGIRTDFWAMMRIIDRAFGTFFRGQVLVGLATGLATYLGLRVLVRLGAPDSPYMVTLAVMAGLLQLIPEIGPLINILLTTFIAYRVSGMLALYVLGLYLSIQFLIGKLVKDRIEQRIIDVNPALLVLIIVALSQLGFFWLFLAAPVAGVTRDLFRYIYGRLSEPPRPAGLLPGEPLPARAPVQPTVPLQRKTPLVYQRMQKKPGRQKVS